MSFPRKAVLSCAALLFLSWLVVNFGRLTGDQEGIIRLVLGLVLSVSILLRWKPGVTAARPAPRFAPAAGVAGAALVVTGIIFSVHQAEWLGIVLLLYASLRWALPPVWSKDILLALLLLYWLHPLPGQVFGQFQLAMQKASIRGAEWLLHCLNVRVWADDSVLRAIPRAVPVPEECSGMRTAVTVLLCSLGTGLLLRLRPRAIAGVLLLGLAQVLALNAARIASIVMFAPRMYEGWGMKLLHDTAGLFLLVSILLIQFEAGWWKLRDVKRTARRKGRLRGSVERPEKAFRVPHFWHLARKWFGLVAGAAVLLAFGAGLAYKSRPSHREVMRREVLDHIVEHEPDVAARAVGLFLAASPADRGLLSIKARVEAMQDRYKDALETLNGLSGELDVHEKLLKSIALMRLDRPGEVAAVMSTLPRDSERWPLVAMLRAEFAASQDQLEGVVNNIGVAVLSHRNIDRVRNLFPYLAIREQWAVISESDRDRPFRQLEPALAAVAAHRRVGRPDLLSRAMLHALPKWPTEPRFLSALFELAARNAGSQWESRFEAVFRANLNRLNSSDLSTFIGHAFQLVRPDLAWMAFSRLAALDPEDPNLHLALARFWPRWLLVRRQALSIPSAERFETLDLKPLYALGRASWPCAGLWRQVPAVEELMSTNAAAMRRGHLDKCLAVLGKRQAAGQLNKSLQWTYPFALALAGRLNEAHEQLDKTAALYPNMTGRVQIEHAALYGGQGNWQKAYEALRKVLGENNIPNMQVDLLLMHAMLNMNLGMGALEVARRAGEEFPGSDLVRLAEAAIWDAFGYKEQALFLIGSTPFGASSGAVAQLLYDTGRYAEADKLSRLTRTPLMTVLDRPTDLYYPPAELVLDKTWPDPPSAAELANAAATAARQAQEASSPFVRALEERTARWYRNRSEGKVDLTEWRATGRDAMESAVALHRLAALAARQKDNALAVDALNLALEELPRAAILHRMLIVLSGGDTAVVDRARMACPDDPEIWLASLIVRTRKQGAGDWAVAEVTQAAQGSEFSVGTMVRAGEFLVRHDMVKAACVAARDAIARGQGLVAADLLGLRCAIESRDIKWALSCAVSGAAKAINPTPFHRSVVFLKDVRQESDTDMIASLERLRELFPKQPQWTARLSDIYFEKGDTKRVLSALEPLIARGSEQFGLRSYLIASEAARLEGDPGKSVRFLEIADTIYPDRVSVLNNLVYQYAQDAASLTKARDLLPKLIEQAGDSAEVFDTAAVVYMNSGQFDEAWKHSSKALSLMNKDTYAAADIKWNAAVIRYRRGELDEARRLIDEVLKDPRCSEKVAYTARKLDETIRVHLGKER